MKTGFIPTGNYSLFDLVEIGVREIYGETSASQFVEDDSGIKHNSRVWSIEWQSCYELIQEALASGALTAYFESDGEKFIQKTDWVVPDGDSFTWSWKTLAYGTLQHGDEQSSYGKPVYVREEEANQWLDSLKESNSPSDKNKNSSRIKKENKWLKEADSWEQVALMISKAGITIKVKKRERQFSFEEFKRLIPETKPRLFLYQLFNTAGVFDSSDFSGPHSNYLKVYVSDLRRELKSIFDLPDEPIISKGSGAYQTAFSIIKPIISSDHIQNLSPDDNTPDSVRQQISSNPQDDLLT